MVSENSRLTPIIAIVGPTAVGKTSLAIALAKKLDTEIISADSMQFYQKLDIGTAKVSIEEMQGIKHHLIDILSPNDEFSVLQYQQIVRQKIDEFNQMNKIPILVGGSGLFLQSVLYDYRFYGNQREQNTKTKLEELSNSELYEYLKTMNPSLAKTIDVNNRRRVERSIEIANEDIQTQKKHGNNLFYEQVFIIGLDLNREDLYTRINQRVDLMLEQGLLQEAEMVYKDYLNTQASMAIGYKEFFPFFEGKESLETAIETLKRNTRRYAKRQYTWFRNKMNVRWYDVSITTLEEICDDVKQWLKKRAY